MFKQVRSGWPKAIRSIRNSVNTGPMILKCATRLCNYRPLKLIVLVLWRSTIYRQFSKSTLLFFNQRIACLSLKAILQFLNYAEPAKCMERTKRGERERMNLNAWRCYCCNSIQFKFSSFLLLSLWGLIVFECCKNANLSIICQKNERPNASRSEETKLDFLYKSDNMRR